MQIGGGYPLFANSDETLLRRDQPALIREKIDQLAVEPPALSANVKKPHGRPQRISVSGAIMTVQIIEIAGNRMAILPEDEYRTAELASRIGMSNMTVSTMEKASRPGGVKVWRALSEAPNVAVEDRLPEV